MNIARCAVIGLLSTDSRMKRTFAAGRRQNPNILISAE